MPAASSISVLVVDDQMTIRSLVRSGLQQIGISNVEEAADGEQGLRNLIARPATLVITDFNMPKLDGLGLLRAIRAHPPIYLVKPFTVGTLKDKIEAVVGALT